MSILYKPGNPEPVPEDEKLHGNGKKKTFRRCKFEKKDKQGRNIMGKEVEAKFVTTGGCYMLQCY
jgi:hypothetical protein